MVKQWELISFDSEGNKVKQLFDTEMEAYDFTINHELEVFSIKSDWYGTSI